MKILVLAALVAAVTAARLSGENNQQTQQQSPFQVGKLYRYDVNSHTLARLEEGERTGSAFRARFVVRVSEPGKLLAKLENPEHAPIHQELPNNWQLPEDLEYQPVKNLDLPFEIEVNGGRVQSLNLPATLSQQHENLLKGLISALQVDLTSHRNVRSHNNNFDSETQQGNFKKMETDVTGDCETLYSVTPAASEWRRELSDPNWTEEPVVITKSKDYSNCNHRIDYHFGVPNNMKWTGIARNYRDRQFVKRATISEMLVARNGPIYKTETTSTVHVNPHMYGKQQGEVLSFVRMNLVSYEQDNLSEWKMPEVNRPAVNLMFAMSSKNIEIQDASSEESVEHDRIRRSPKMTRSENQFRNRKSNDESSNSLESSEEQSSAYVNDDIPDMKAPAYAALYMNPEPRDEKKQTPMNAQKLVQEIAQQLQNPNNMPKSDILSKFNMLVHVIASMNTDQLAQTSRGIENGRATNNIIKSDMWMIFRDAVAQAGTLPAFQQIKIWVLKKTIQGEEAAQVLASLVHTLRYPTKEVMLQFFALAMSDEVKQQMNLNSTALIAATKLINMAQVNNRTAHSYYPTHMYGRLSNKHERFVIDEIIPRLNQELKQAIEQRDDHKTQVYIVAIGNLGHRAILEVFAPYLEGKQQVPTYLRALMVDNLLVVAQQNDRRVRAVLYNILRNTAENYEVRVAAVKNMFVANPSPAMMLTMAKMTHNDPSMHVRAALKSAIESAAEIRDPKYTHLTRTAQAALWITSKKDLGNFYSIKKDTDFYDGEPELRVVKSSTGSRDSLFPKTYEFSMKNQAMGWYNLNKIATKLSNVPQFVDILMRTLSNQKRDSNNSPPDFKFSAEKIAQVLNLKHEPQKPLQAAFYLDLLNQQRFFALGDHQLQQLPEVISRHIDNLAKGIESHYTKIINSAQVSIMFPLASGMPFIYKYKEPTLVHIQAKSKGDIKLPSEENNRITGSLDKEIQLTFARNLDGRVGFLDTLSNHFASAGVVSKVQLTVPIKLQAEIKMGKLKIKLEPLRPDQDTTIAHYSVWPYTSRQKKDSLTTVSIDPTTKLIMRNKKEHNIETKIGQSIGAQFQIQGYSYSKDYRSLANMFTSPYLEANLANFLRQRDVALTHYNFRFLGKQSQNKAVTFTVVYDDFLAKNSEPGQLVASDLSDNTPNSETRRQEIVKRVSSGIENARYQGIEFSASFSGAQNIDYVLTAAMAESPIDKKIQYALFSGRNSAKLGNNQVNLVGVIKKPSVTSLNYLETLKRELRTNFNVDIKLSNDGNIQIQGHSERTQKCTEELKKLPIAKQAANEISKNNLYQPASHKMIVLAHAPNYMKASVTYKDVSPAIRNMTYHAYRLAQHLAFWNTDVNIQKFNANGKIDVEVEASYSEDTMNMALSSNIGELRMKNVPIPKVSSSIMSAYTPLKTHERVLNYLLKDQYLPYSTIDGDAVKTFSNRTYDYTLTRSWHVVMQDDAKFHGIRGQNKEQLVILARRPNKEQLETYISFRSDNGKDVEIELKPSSDNNAKVKVNTSVKKTLDGALVMYQDDTDNKPLLQYYTLPDGVLMLNIRDDRIRAMYDGQRLVIFTKEHRNNIRGIAGRMSGERRDDYLTPNGLVDKPEHFAASFSLNVEDSEPQTLELQNQAKQVAYQPQTKYTVIQNFDNEWDESDEKNMNSQNVYRSRNFLKKRGECQLQQQVQYFENGAEICITTTPLPACQSHCNNGGYEVQNVQVVCRSRLDQEFQTIRNQIRQGQNPQVTGSSQNKKYRVPKTCQA